MNWSYDNYMTYARGVVHDAANPANAISMHLELLELLLKGNTKAADVLARSRVDLRRTLSAVRRAMYVPDVSISSARESVGLANSINDAWPLACPADKRLSCECEGNVSASPGLLQQALIQLLSNAAAFGDGDIRCEGSGGVLKIVNPSRQAIEPVGSWLEPGFSSRLEQGHLGIGLNIAQGALESFGVRLDLTLHDGTCTAIVTFSDHGQE